MGANGTAKFKKTATKNTIIQQLYCLGKLLFYALDFNLPADEERGDLPELLEDFLYRLLENEIHIVNTQSPGLSQSSHDEQRSLGISLNGTTSSCDDSENETDEAFVTTEHLAPDEGFSADADDVLLPDDSSGRIQSFSQVIRVNSCIGAARNYENI